MKNAFILTVLFFIIPTIAFAQVVFPNRGGTGSSVIPALGEVLVGQGDGTYAPVATSSLGIVGTGGASGGDGLATTSIDTEAELQAILTDVTDVFTNNDGALSDDDLSDNTTTDLAEGTSLYYTEARVQAELLQGNNATFTAATSTTFAVTGLFNFLGTKITNVGTWFSGLFDTYFSAKDTDDLSEGSTNQYWTNTRFDQRLAATTSLPNLTITESQVSDLDHYTDNDVSVYISGSSTITRLGQTIDISDETNLAGDSEIVLTGDSLSLAASVARDNELHSAITLSGALDYITLVGQDIVRGAIDLATDITGILGLASGGTGASLADPNADRIIFWDDSAGATTWLTIGTGMDITGTTLSSTVVGGTGLSTTSIDTEAELEAILSDVTDVFTNNDGALSDDDLSDNSTTDLAEGTNLYWTNTRFDQRLSATTSLPNLAITESQISDLDHYTDNDASVYISGSTSITRLGQTIDISDETNLAGDSEIVLTGDTLSLAASVARDSELHNAVTLSGSLDYLTLTGQDIVRGAIDLATDITGTLPAANGGTGLTSTATFLFESELNSEAELEALLADVSNVFTNNDGALSDDDLSDNTTTDLAEGTNLYYTVGRAQTALTAAYNAIFNNATTSDLSITDVLTFNGVAGTSWPAFCVAITGGSGLCDGVDNVGSGGGGLATSTDIVDTYVIYGTSASDVGGEAAFTYNDATNRLTVNFASSTAITATNFHGALLGNANTATALATNGSNCTTGQAPLGVDASGAVESCFDVWTEAENTAAAYLDSADIGSTVQAYDAELAAIAALATTDSNIIVGNGSTWVAESGSTARTSLGLGSLATLSAIDISDNTNLSVTATGLQLSGDAIALATGFTIPTTTNTANWNTAFSWGNHATAGYLSSTAGDWTGTFDGLEGSAYLARANHTGTQAASTISDFDTEVSNNTDVSANTTARHAAITLSGALDYITLVGQDIVRGAIDLATDVTGVLGIANGGLGAAFTDPNADRLMFFDDSAGAITGLTSLVGAAISGTTLTINDVTCTDCLTSTEIADEYLLNSGDVGTGDYDFGGATFLEIPNGAAPVVNDPGEIAHDTTDNQLIVDDYVVQLSNQRIWGATIASTSPAFINGGLLKVPTQLDGYTMTAIRCSVQGGTSKVIAVEDESTNSTENITCATSVTSDDGTITNATVTAGEEMYIDFGATTGAVDYVTISVFGNWTRE